MQLALAAGEMGAWEWHPQSNNFVWLHGAAALHGVAQTEKPIVLSLDDYLHYVHLEDRQKLLDVLAGAIGEGKNHHAEYRVVQPDGTMLTGWGQESDKKQALEARFDEHRVMPVGLEKLQSIGVTT
jgi:PAS domain-containing protein